jgi:hypothetical protein
LEDAEYVPGEQLVHKLAPAEDHWPGRHDMGANDVVGHMLPAGQMLQSALDLAPEASEYEPDAHATQVATEVAPR